MMSWRLTEILRHATGQLVGEDRAFSSVSTDTRTLKPGALFVALTGPNFDGHNFVAQAAERGAAAALVDRPVAVALPQAVVSDSLAALSAFARQWRRQFHIPLIGVTGSNGKTTTKELLSAILSRIAPTLVTRGNLNNHIGVPLTLLELTAAHRYAIVEMGANHRGEIAHLAGIAEPTIGLVTNAGAAHLEGFGGLEGVALGKSEMFRQLPRDGVAVVNADDVYAPMWRDCRSAERCLTFGIEQTADFMARSIQSGEVAGGFRIDFELLTPDGVRTARLGLGGMHNLRNALAAAAAAYAAGASLDDLVAGLAAMRAVAGRLDLKAALNGAFLVDDSYNANPSSLKAGLDVLRSFKGTRWLVLGDMLELGERENELHAEIGRYAKESGIARLLAVGARSRFAVEAFGRGARWFADMDSLIAEARSSLAPGTAVLVKGSHSSRLDRVATALAAVPPKAANGH
jgi:UDP-N-acetylmuramoyl-tripeptide--D-alanyl-D-alanine ligase